MSSQVYKKNKLYKNESQTIRLTSLFSTVFLLYMCAVFPLVMHDGYLDITLTRFTLFKVGVMVYSILMCLAAILRLTDRDDSHVGKKSKAKKRSKIAEKDGFRLLPSDIWFCLFFLTGFLSWLLSDDKRAAFTGEMGRRCGFVFLILACLLYVCLGSGYRMKEWVLPVAVAVADGCFLMSILQHMNIDVFYLLEKIREDQRAVFISTFGNINIYASFVCMAAVFLMGLYMLEADKRLRVFYGASIVFSGAAVIAANSDSAYIGLFAGALTLCLFAVYKEKLFAFFQSVTLAFAGFTGMAAVTALSGRGYKKLTGIAAVSRYWYVLLAVCLLLITGVFGGMILKKKRTNRTVPMDKTQKGKDDCKKRKNRMVFWILGGVCVCCIIVVGVGCMQRWRIFTFDDTWGDYRGYVWTRLCRIYRKLPFLNQFFGYGQESIYALMSESYADEMISVTGTVYDSAHNEYLQYLITMGACGLICYLGVIVTSVQNCVRLARVNRMGAPLAAAILAYAAQASVNVEQPITTPFFFLGIALVAGLCRRSFAEEAT